MRGWHALAVISDPPVKVLSALVSLDVHPPNTVLCLATRIRFVREAAAARPVHVNPIVVRLAAGAATRDQGLRFDVPRSYHRQVSMPAISVYARVPLEVDERSALGAAACIFRSLGDPARLAIIQHLALGEHRVVDLTAHLGLAQSTVSAHLACLRDCGLVTSRPQGRASMFSLARPELLVLLASAERLLAATGDAVVLCPAYGHGAGL